MQVYVGADWSARRLVCAVAQGDGAPRRIQGAGPTLVDIRDLIARVRERHPEASEVLVMIEAGAPGWVKLLYEAGATVFVADPKQAKRYAESLCSSGAKADKRDAVTLVHMLRSPAHRGEAWEPRPQLEGLRRLSAIHEQLTRQQSKVKQQLRSRLNELMPLVSDQIGDLAARWARRFLEAVPTPWHAKTLDRAYFGKLTRRAHIDRRERLWQALALTEAPWLDEDLAELEALHLRVLLQQLGQLREQLAIVNQRVDEVTRGFANRDLLESVDGIGLHQAALLLAFGYGQPLAHRDEGAINMGASPVFVGSGNDADGRPKGQAKVRRSANRLARRCSYLLGVIATRFLAWAKAMYADGRARGQSAATAYRRIARSMHRILSAMVRYREPYDDARYVAALQSKGVSWAMGL